MSVWEKLRKYMNNTEKSEVESRWRNLFNVNRAKPRSSARISLKEIPADNQAPIIFLINETTGDFLKINAEELFFWNNFDGNTSIEQISEVYVRQKRNLPHDIGGFVNQLNSQNFLNVKPVNFYQNLSNAIAKKWICGKLKTSIKQILSIELNNSAFQKAIGKIAKLLNNKTIKVLTVCWLIILTITGIYNLSHANFYSGEMENISHIWVLALLGIGSLGCLWCREIARSITIILLGGFSKTSISIKYFAPIIKVDSCLEILRSEKAHLILGAIIILTELALMGFLSLIPCCSIAVLSACFFIVMDMSPSLPGVFRQTIERYFNIDNLWIRTRKFAANKLLSRLLSNKKWTLEETLLSFWLLLAVIWVTIVLQFASKLLSQYLFPSIAKILSSGAIIDKIASAFFALLLTLFCVSILTAVFEGLISLVKGQIKKTQYLDHPTSIAKYSSIFSLLLGLSLIICSENYERNLIIFVSLLGFLSSFALIKMVLGSRQIIVWLLYAGAVAAHLIANTVRGVSANIYIAGFSLPIFLEIASAFLISGSALILCFENGIKFLLAREWIILIASLSTGVIPIISLFLTNDLTYIIGMGYLPLALLFSVYLLTTAISIQRLSVAWRTPFWFPYLLFLLGCLFITVNNLLLIKAVLSAGSYIPSYWVIKFNSVGVVILSFMPFVFFCTSSKIRFPRRQQLGYQAANDMERLKYAAGFLWGSIQKHLSNNFGYRQANFVYEHIKIKADQGRWHVNISNNEFVFSENLTIHQLGDSIEQILLEQSTLWSKRIGIGFTRQAQTESYDELYWIERELLTEYVFKNQLEEVPTLNLDILPKDTFLSLAPYFSKLPTDVLEDVLSHLSIRKIHPGEVVVNQGEEGDSFYIIFSGIAEVLSSDIAGFEQRLALLHKGDYFGETALLENITRTATVRALTNLLVFQLKKNDFLKLVNISDSTGLCLAGLADRANLLRQIVLFHNLSPIQVRILAGRCSIKKFLKNDIIIKEGQPGYEMFILVSGKVEVIHGDPSFTKTGVLGPKEYFGEIALLKECPRTATVRTLEDADTLVLTKADFDKIIADTGTARREAEKVSSRRLYDLSQKEHIL